MENIQQHEQITSLKVLNLFGRFNHELIFPEDQEISIVAAPNGYGKTVLLRIMDSVFNNRLTFLWRIEFEEIEIRFASRKSILIHKDRGDQHDDGSAENPSSVIFTSDGFGANGETHRLSPKLSSSSLRRFERHLPVEEIGPDRWRDYQLDRTVTTAELIELYADQLPGTFIRSLKSPDWLRHAINSIDVHLVETQRLLYLEEPEERRPHSRRVRVNPPSVVERDATDLAEHIGQLLQQYANESQKLDQTFPKRILEFRAGPVSSENKISESLAELTLKRDDLMSVGLFGSTISEPIQPYDILKDESIRRILSIYAEDTKKKLSIFDSTYAKIRLFKQILDEHFSFKTISINPEKGISAIDNDSEDAIPLSELSSGEQHELVLIYELLFKVEDGAVILIDEPELSLHVSWQKRFISDLQKIQNLKKMNVVIATHSPQVINDNWELVQDLTSELTDD